MDAAATAERLSPPLSDASLLPGDAPVETAQETGTPPDATSDARVRPDGCVGAPGTVFAHLPDRPSGLAIDDQNLYSGAGGNLWSLPKTGAPGAVVWTGEGVIRRMVLDGPHVYFTNETVTETAVWRVPRTGGAAERLAMGLDGANELTIDGAFVYWTEGGQRPDWHGRVSRVAKAGGPVQVLVNDVRGTGVVVDGHDVYYLVGDTFVGPGRLMKTSVEGGPSTPVREGDAAGKQLMATSTALFALIYNEVLRIDKRTGATLRFPGRSVGGHSLALDDTNVYWTVEGYGDRPEPHEGGRILKGPLGGGPTTDSRTASRSRPTSPSTPPTSTGCSG